MPESIELDISEITLGQTIKVREVEIDNFEILNSPQVSIASVSIPRAAKLGDEEEEEELEEGEEGAEEGGESAAKEEGEEKSAE
jgi:large subunit ribosomal protein L25